MASRSLSWDTAKIVWPHYDPEAVHATLGRAGRIAFEVHDNDPLLGHTQWVSGARCRWRNVRVKEL